jgi:iron-sulfur cluster repair protein YtfE (RIC family)
MDVYQILMQDHQLIQQIFSEIEQTGDGEVERREQLFERLQKELEDHAVVEEEIFYPEIGTYPETLELVADAFDDHAEFGAILQEIFEMRTNRDDWLERITEPRILVEQHMHKEEEKIFQLARTKLDESRAEQLNAQQAPALGSQTMGKS